MTTIGTQRVREQARDPKQAETTLVGANFARYPYISALGIMIRVSRLHVLQKSMIFRYLGLRITRHDNIPTILATSTARKDQIAKHTACDASIRQVWDIQPWIPFKTTLSDSELLTPLRVCPCCARTGYHTLLFHLPWIERCPWHGEHLINGCRRCHRPLMTEFTDEILPLQCRCGSDLFDRRLAVCGDSIVDTQSRNWQGRYLEWASAGRSSCQLIAESGIRGLHVSDLGTLIDLPIDLSTKCHDASKTKARCHVRVLKPLMTVATASTSREFIQSMKYLPVVNHRAISIPASLLRPFQAVAQSVVAALPPRSLIEGDLLRIYPCDTLRHTERPMGLPHGKHVDLTFLPFHQTPAGGVLDCASIDKTVRAVVYQCAQGPQSDQAGITSQNPDPESQVVLAALGKRVLLHAYAQGVRTVLGCHLATIYGLPQYKSRPQRPVVMLFLDGLRVNKAHLIWATPLPESADQTRL